jgi:ribosomal protein S18 acetylase RimI-like enzyme
MTEVRVRGATPGDVAFLRRMQWEALMASARFVAAMGLETLREIEERVWAAWPGPDETAFVAEDARGRPLGALVLRVQERDGQRVVGYRLAMAVEADARRQGIGRDLLEHAKRFSQAAGAAYLLLYVDPSNDPALQAYLVAGFQLGDIHGVVPMIVRFESAIDG